MASGGARAAAHDQVLAEGTDGLEFLELDSGKRVDPGVVDLDKLAREGGFHPVAPALRGAFWEVAAPFGAETAAGGDASGEPMVLLPEEVQAKFAAEGIAASHLPDEVFLRVGPARGSAEAGQAGGIEPFLPSVIGGPVVQGQSAVEWVGQNWDLHASGPPYCGCSYPGYRKQPQRHSPEHRRVPETPLEPGFTPNPVSPVSEP